LIGELILDQPRRDVGHDYLPPMSASRDSAGSMDIHAYVVVTTE
jgi:hypothetical protein